MAILGDTNGTDHHLIDAKYLVPVIASVVTLPQSTRYRTCVEHLLLASVFRDDGRNGTYTATDVIGAHLVPVVIRRAVVARLVGGETLHLVAEFAQTVFVHLSGLNVATQQFLDFPSAFRRLSRLSSGTRCVGRLIRNSSNRVSGVAHLPSCESEDSSSRSSEYRFQLHGLGFVNQEFESYNKRSACQLILFTTSAPNSG